MSDKSGEDEVPAETPEQQYINFIKDRLEKHGILNLQNLTGHLSSLPSLLRNKFGTSKSCLKKFIKEHSDSFKLDRKENVEIATFQEKYNRLDSISSEDGVLVQKLIDEGARMEVKPKETTTLDLGETEIPHPRDDLPFELKEMKGKVYRLFQVYGFITVKNPRLQASVYFDLQSFENGKLESFSDSHLKIGQGIYLNARKGPDNCEAQYRASLVWRPESTEYFQVFSNGSQESDAKEISGCGKIHNLFQKYGFISRNTSVRDNVFFHLNNVVIPNEIEVLSLLDTFKIGDMVKFHAIPSEQKDSNIKWQATHVWLDQSSDAASKDGNEIFISDSESYDSASDRNDGDNEYDGVDNYKNSSIDSENDPLDTAKPEVCSKQISNSVSSLSPIALPFYATPPTQLNGDVSKTINNQIGILAAKTKDLAIIIFGERYMHRSLTSSEDMFINGEKVHDFLLELGENARVQFDAVFQANGPYDCHWKTLLAWMGKRPDPILKRKLAPIAQPSLSSGPSNDWASIVEMDQRQLERRDSQSSEISSTGQSYKKITRPIRKESITITRSQPYSQKSEASSPLSVFSKEAIQPPSLSSIPNTYPHQSRFINHFNAMANQEAENMSRISSQTLPLGMFSMSSLPNSYSQFQSKAPVQDHHSIRNAIGTYMTPHYLQSVFSPSNNSNLNQPTIGSEPPGMISNYSASGNMSPSNTLLEQKILELTQLVETLRKQQEFSKSNDNERTKCYKEVATQTIDYPSEERQSVYASSKNTRTKLVQTYSTGKVMFEELYLGGS